MDPNLFHLDWERTLEAMTAIVVLSFVLERALAMIFDNYYFIKRFRETPAKEIIAFGVALLVCMYWDFDAISVMILKETTTFPGKLITAGVIAGGSKGSVKLFRDVLGVKSIALQEREDQQKAEREQE